MLFLKDIIFNYQKHSYQRLKISSSFLDELTVPRTLAELPRCTAMEHLWSRNWVDLDSPVFSLTILPISLTSFKPSCPHEPNVSIAIGTNKYSFSSSWYWSIFFISAFSAALPGCLAVWSTYDAARVSTTVESQIRHFPSLKGNSLNPSGRLPSFLLNPVSSSFDG